ncbi:MAG: metal-dependent hydrolase [Deltaproteobacteria bacterium]|nr:MAG: metal-dependent hydrolase [Deltaproteobacteria bacterium]
MTAIPVRRVRPDLSDVPRDWVRGDPQLTHVINGLFALFPEGERMFVRAVRHYEAQTAVEAERLRGFYGQEANHGVAHRDAFRMLEAQGYEIESWLAWYKDFGYRRIETRVPPVFRLSITAALEHFTATLAEVAFDPDELVADVHPEMQHLIYWHAAEEIEHRSVAFDVLQEVDPRLRVRVAGFAAAVTLLTGFGMSASAHLGQQDGTRGCRRRLLVEFLRRPRILTSALRYCRRDFHPDEAGEHVAAMAFLRELDAAMAAA